MRFLDNVIEEAEADPNYWPNQFKATFGTEAGKKTLIKLYQMSGFYTVTADRNEAAINDGKRLFMLDILEMIKIDPIEADQSDKNAMNFLEEVLNMEAETNE